METIYNLFSIDLVQALSWTLLHSMWQALLIACILSILIKCAHQLNAQTKTLISLGALISLFMASIITFSYYYNPASAIATEDLITAGAWQEFATTISAEQGQVTTSISNYIMQNSQFIVLTWLVGFLIFFFRLLFSLYQIQSLKNNLQPLSQNWDVRLQVLAQKLNYSKQIILGESTDISSPITFGFLKPIILFPIGMINQLSIQEVEGIMAHELAHIVRKDYLINFIQTLLEGIYYFNPGAWIISSIIRTQREHCCDDIAIALTGNSTHYLKALVAIEESKQNNNLAMAFSSNKKPLLQRVQRILKQPQKNNNMKEKLIMTALFLIGLLLFTLDVNSKNISSEEETVLFENNLFEYISSPINSEFEELRDTTPLEVSMDLDKNDDSTNTIDFDDMVKDGDVKIILKDGEIKQVEINGKELSEEEIDKIEYKPSDEEEINKNENADINNYEGEENEIDEDLGGVNSRREAEKLKADIRKDRENAKREIRKSISQIRKDKERIKQEIQAEKEKMKAEIRRSSGSSTSQFFDVDFEEISEEISMNIAEAFEDIEFDIDELLEEKDELMIEIEESIQEGMEDLQEGLADLNFEIHEGLADVYIDMKDYANTSTEELINALESELLSDNLIDDTEKYSFLLKKNKFQVNGKNMTASLKNKYVTLLSELTNNEWSSESKLKIIRKGNSSITGFMLKN